ncbi:MAG: hypothetical protein Q7R87_02420 [Nanoarchaeota archaeon]|nr:hypothetical protein [Nanoarchaeota archaeon]
MANHYQIRFLDKSKETLTQEELNNVIEQTNVLKHIRGNFLDYIIEIELIICILTENFMIHKKSNLRKVFRKNILNNKGVSFKQKIELLSEILKEKKMLPETDLNLLNRNLNSLRDDRNRWAHGVIRFEQEKKGKDIKFQSYLNYINSEGNEKDEILTNSYFDNLTAKFNTTKKLLVKVLVKRGFLSKDYLFKK